MSKWLKGLAVAAVASASTVCNAAMISDMEYIYSDLLDKGQSISWTHDLSEYNFVLGSAVEAFLTIDLDDDLGNGQGQGNGNNTGLPDNQKETAQITINLNEVFTSDSNNQVNWFFSSGELSFESLFSINQNGLLDVSVKSLHGDFFVKWSQLMVFTDDNYVPPAAVPEPGTVALLGLGLLGLGIARRKIQG